jgi:hypothetical protein
MSAPSIPAHPPKPRLTLRVGVTGKRKLPAGERGRIERELGDVLDTLQQLILECRNGDGNRAVLSDDPPVLRVITGLAEGTDRLAADVTVRRARRDAGGDTVQTRLAAILPFPRDEYANDFRVDPDKEKGANIRSDAEWRRAVGAFEELLAEIDRQKESVLEIDDEAALADNGKHRDHGYVALRDLLIQHSDVLIAVSDDIYGGGGGTVDVIRAAIIEGIPVIKISTRAVPVRLMYAAELDDPDQAPKEGETLEPGGRPPRTLVDALKPTLWPPQPPSREPEQGAAAAQHRPHKSLRPGLTRLTDFVGERFDLAGFSWIFKACRNALTEWAKCRWMGCFPAAWKAFRTTRKTYRVDSPGEVIAKLWQSRDALSAPYNGEQRFREILAHRHAWADALAVCYADDTRSSYIAIAACGALAVLVGLLAVLFWGVLATPFKVLLLLAEGAILSLAGKRFYRPAHDGSWHERMVEYRVLAELLRHQRFVYAFGGAERAERSGDRSWREPDAWLGWYARATTRELGFPAVRLSPEYRRTALAAFQLEELEAQIEYNKIERGRSRVIDDSLGIFVERTWRAAVGIAFAGAAIVSLLFVLKLLPGPLHTPAETLLDRGKPLLTIILAFLPALIAAVHGVRFQMEFANAARRAEATYRELSAINENRIKPLLASGDPPGRRKSYALVRLTNEAMVADLAGWSTVYKHKAAEPP